MPSLLQHGKGWALSGRVWRECHVCSVSYKISWRPCDKKSSTQQVEQMALLALATFPESQFPFFKVAVIVNSQVDFLGTLPSVFAFPHLRK